MHHKIKEEKMRRLFSLLNQTVDNQAAAICAVLPLAYGDKGEIDVCLNSTPFYA